MDKEEPITAHHPIPPDCEFFQQFLGAWQFHWPNGSFAWVAHYDYFPEKTKERHVIACVAQCAWHEAAFKLLQKCTVDGRVHFRYGIEDEPENEAHEQALENADAWRKWGSLDAEKL